jgi:hypothetical protein
VIVRHAGGLEIAADKETESFFESNVQRKPTGFQQSRCFHIDDPYTKSNAVVVLNPANKWQYLSHHSERGNIERNKLKKRKTRVAIVDQDIGISYVDVLWLHHSLCPSLRKLPHLVKFET